MSIFYKWSHNNVTVGSLGKYWMKFIHALVNLVKYCWFWIHALQLERPEIYFSSWLFLFVCFLQHTSVNILWCKNICPLLLKQVSSSHNKIFLYASHHIGIHKYLQSPATDWRHNWSLVSSITVNHFPLFTPSTDVQNTVYLYINVRV